MSSIVQCYYVLHCTDPAYRHNSARQNRTMSNTSVLEAWFSLVRQIKLDSATSYPTAVSTRQMKSASALAMNGMYSEEQAGQFAKEDTMIGPDQVINTTAKKKKDKGPTGSEK